MPLRQQRGLLRRRRLCARLRRQALRWRRCQRAAAVASGHGNGPRQGAGSAGRGEAARRGECQVGAATVERSCEGGGLPGGGVAQQAVQLRCILRTCKDAAAAGSVSVSGGWHVQRSGRSSQAVPRTYRQRGDGCLGDDATTRRAATPLGYYTQAGPPCPCTETLACPSGVHKCSWALSAGGSWPAECAPSAVGGTMASSGAGGAMCVAGTAILRANLWRVHGGGRALRPAR